MIRISHFQRFVIIGERFQQLHKLPSGVGRHQCHKTLKNRVRLSELFQFNARVFDVQRDYVAGYAVCFLFQMA